MIDKTGQTVSKRSIKLNSWTTISARSLDKFDDVELYSIRGNILQGISKINGNTITVTDSMYGVWADTNEIKWIDGCKWHKEVLVTR